MSLIPFDQAVLESPTYNRGRTHDAVPSHIDPADIVKLSSNENAFGTSPNVAKAISAVANGVALYPPRDGDHNLSEALAAFHDSGLTAENVVAGNGGLDILDLVARGFVKAGDEVIMCQPTFAFLRMATSRLGGTIINVPLDSETYALNVDGILNAVTDKTRIVYVCNPNNPSGNIVPPADFQRLVDNLPKRIIILSDEAYAPFTTQGLMPDTIGYIKNGAPIINLYSFSKLFGMAGMRLGYAVSTPEITAYLSRLRRPFHLSSITLAAGMAAIADQDHINHVIESTRTGRQWLTGQLQELGVHVWPSETNFLLMRSPTLDGNALTDGLLQRGIIVSAGERRFGLPACIRVTVGTPEQNRRFIDAMSELHAPVAV